ncbi:MAG: hypothetical protein ACYC0Y_25635 [Pirellulales bacterium]
MERSVSQVARHIGARPRDISNLFYQRKLRDDLCPIVAGRRRIPEEYLDCIVKVLRREHKPVNPPSPIESCQD